jgi:hypothetical protein
MLHVLIPTLFACVLAVTGPAGRHRVPLTPLPPLPEPAGWVAAIDHPYFPLRPGTLYVYSSGAGTGIDVDSILVTHETKTILGIPAVVVRDRTFHNGSLTEDSFDWYAQDKDGNVWYLGEDSKGFRNGKVVSTAGSWESGKKGAQPGIIMRARPRVGVAYRQEHCPRVAEDMARVLSLDEKVSVPCGEFANCVETEEWSPLEPGVKEHKYYARDVGMVLQRTVAGGNEEMVLVKVIAP